MACYLLVAKPIKWKFNRTTAIVIQGNEWKCRLRNGVYFVSTYYFLLLNFICSAIFRVYCKEKVASLDSIHISDLSSWRIGLIIRTAKLKDGHEWCVCWNYDCNRLIGGRHRKLFCKLEYLTNNLRSLFIVGLAWWAWWTNMRRQCNIY